MNLREGYEAHISHRAATIGGTGRERLSRPGSLPMCAGRSRGSSMPGGGGLEKSGLGRKVTDKLWIRTTLVDNLCQVHSLGLP
jgi:hypothetical protein